MVRNFKLTAIILSLLLVLLMVPSVLAADCTGSACSCGDFIAGSKTLSASDFTSSCTTAANGLTILADDVVLDCAGIEINQANYLGVGISSTYDNVTVKNCVLDGWNQSIRFSGTASNLNVLDNNITNSGTKGIYFPTGGSGYLIDGNRIYNSGRSEFDTKAIDFIANNGIITNNDIQNISGIATSTVVGGIMIYGSNTTVDSNNITNISSTTTFGLGLLGGANVTFSNNRISQVSYGLINRFDPNNPVINNTAISNNVFNSIATVGVLTQGNISSITGNTITMNSGATAGIQSSSSILESVSGNTVSAGGSIAIKLSTAQGTVVTNNAISLASTGILVEGTSTDANITGQILTGCCSSYGISISDSSTATISSITANDFDTPVISVVGAGAVSIDSSSFENISKVPILSALSSSLTLTNNNFDSVEPSQTPLFLMASLPVTVNSRIENLVVLAANSDFSQTASLSSDDVLISFATGADTYDLYAGYLGDQTGLPQNTTIILQGPFASDCTSAEAALSSFGNPRCDAYIDEAFVGTGFGDYDNSNFTNAFNATFNLTSGSTYPPYLRFVNLTSMVATFGTPTTYAGSNTITNSDVVAVEPAASTNTVTETIAVSGSKPSFTLTTGSSTMVASNAYGRINWTGSITADTTLKGNIVIDQDVIAVRSTSLPMLNVSANVTLEGIDCSDFNLFYDGSGSLTAASIRLNGAVVATQANVGGDCTDTNVCQDVACSGSTLTFEAQHFSGYSVGGNSQLTINDSAEGSTAPAGSSVTFYAYYQNLTGDHISGADCNITLDGIVTDAVMSEQGSYYDYTYAYSTQGTKNWNVTCNGASHDDLSATDTLSVSAAVPEWSDLVYVLLLGGLIGLFVVNRKRED